MISHLHQCIFIHIPRTGGTSLEHIIWPDVKARTKADLWMGFTKPFHNNYQTDGLQHLLASQVEQEVGEDVFNSYFKFSIVRNPWDKLVSQFHHIQIREDLRRFMQIETEIDFKRYLELIQLKKHVHWEAQNSFVYDSDGELLVDYIARYENYKQDIQYILNRIKCNSNSQFNLPPTIPHRSKSNRLPYQEYYDPESKNLVHEMYARDIELFNYKFDE